MAPTLGQIRGWAFGRLRLSRQTFYEMRPGEFWEAMQAYQEELEAGRQHIGELVRGATARLFNLQVKKKDQITDVRKFWPMPWDNLKTEAEIVKELSQLTDAQRKEEVNRLLKNIGWNE